MGQKTGQAGAKIGRMGEDAACTHLCSLGQTILERNWRCGHLETDIISLGSDGIHFVEVKARVAPSTTDPSENVGYAKQRNMAKAAARYLATKGSGLGDQEIWFDVVSVLFEGGKASVDYLKGAFLPLGL